MSSIARSDGDSIHRLHFTGHTGCLGASVTATMATAFMDADIIPPGPESGAVMGTVLMGTAAEHVASAEGASMAAEATVVPSGDAGN
ncbi:MAG TPA: hypothetical protein VN745_01795 [Verrucomicrobiae bacterium]|nr:hypothetical protein [Verrucomicrobiae bacterium]